MDEPVVLPGRHDHFFEHWFSKKTVAWQFLQYRLPTSIVSQVVSSSIVKADIRLPSRTVSRYADMLFRGCLKNGKSIYFLLEHKSYHDAAVSWQLCQYMCLIVEMHNRRYPNEDKYPVVIPLLCYHGEEASYVCPSVFKLFDDPTGDMARTMAVGVRTVNLNEISDERYLAEGWTSLGAYVHKHIRNPNIVRKLDQAGRLLRQAVEYGCTVELEVMIDYILNMGPQIDSAVLEAVVRKHTSQQLGDYVMSTAAWLIEKGRKEGEQQGMQQGMQRGVQKGKLQLAKQLLRSGVPANLLARQLKMTVEQVRDLAKKSELV